MDLRWSAADPGDVAAFLAPLRLPIRVEASGHRRPDRLVIHDLAPSPAAPGEGDPFLAVGIATVDMERYARAAGWTIEATSPDPQLGAIAAQVRGLPVVLLEPSTEGRLAGTLARLGEGPAAIYVRPTATAVITAAAERRHAGPRTSAIAEGPFGPQALLLGRPVWGPHVLMVDPAATIRR
jgi:hypothetical protein